MFNNPVFFFLRAGNRVSPVGGSVLCFLSLVVPSVLLTNTSKELKYWSGFVPAPTIPFYGI